MKVNIKQFEVEMEIRNNGVEFEVHSPDGRQHQGDCYVTKTGVTWCAGRTRRDNGIKLSWEELQDILASTEARKAAVKAARSV
jgi:hypothetical protein